MGHMVNILFWYGELPHVSWYTPTITHVSAHPKELYLHVQHSNNMNFNCSFLNKNKKQLILGLYLK